MRHRARERVPARREVMFAASLLAGAAFVHLHRFLLPVDDPDVGVYLHVAFAWLHGNLPYIAAWEYKPPGLFALYALALRLCGERPTIAVQALATLSTWATALALWRLGPLVDLEDGTRSGRYAAIFALLFSTEDEGYLGDAEVLIAPLIAWALVLSLRRHRAAYTTACCGVLCGAALQMKLTALPLIFPVGFALMWTTRRPLGALAGMVAATLAPFAIDAGLYAHSGVFAALWDANVTATWRRFTALGQGVMVENLRWFTEQLRVMAPAVELAPLSFALRRHDRLAFAASWGWLAAALVVIAAAGEFYDRHFVLIMAPLALLGAIGLRVVSRTLGARARAFAVVMFVATFALHDYWETAQAAALVEHRVFLGDRSWHESEYDRIVTALRRYGSGSSVYVIQLTPLLYDALGATAPTRFADSDLLLDDRMRATTGIRGIAELQHVFRGGPRFVAVGGSLSESRFDPRTVSLIRAQLARNYRVRCRVGSATLYERRVTGPANR